MGFDVWWRIEGWPTAAEWQAFWALVAALITLGAVVFAGMQLRKMSEANRQASDAARDQVRPYVQVSLKLEMLPAGNPKEESLEGIAFVAVRNTGASPARNLRLSVDPPFENSGRDGGDIDNAVVLNEVFSEKTTIPMLAAGEEYLYVWDLTEELMAEDSPRPQKHCVSAHYCDSGERPYSDEFILDAMTWRWSHAAPAAIEVIARQFRRLNEKREARTR